jgi:hypothetical protein
MTSNARFRMRLGLCACGCVIGLGALALWVASGRSMLRMWTSPHAQLVAEDGSLDVYVDVQSARTRVEWILATRVSVALWERARWNMRWQRPRMAAIDRRGGVYVSIPLWTAALAGFLLGACFVPKASRAIDGCTRCAYNLTGNVSGSCPECGTPVPASGESKAQGSS